VRKLAELNDMVRKKYGKERVVSGGGPVTMSVTEIPDNIPEQAEIDAYRAKVLNQNDKVEATLTLISPKPSGWFDRVFSSPVQPIALTLDMPDIPSNRVERGELVRLRKPSGGS
jgi:hypothetical protein